MIDLSAGLCGTCSVSKRAAKSLTWQSSGTITEARDPDHRMVLADVEGLNQLFSNIEGLIGVSIQNIITESKARATQEFTRQLIRGWKGTVVRRLGLGIVIKNMAGLAKSLGYGGIEILDVNWKDDRIDFRLRDPYSVPLMCGDLRGATEAVKNVVGTVEPEQESEDTWIVRGRLSPPPSGMEERLAPPPVKTRPGDISYKRCPECGVPLGISDFSWDLDRGIITNRATGIRHAFVGPGGIQAVFDELSSELGDTIPETIIEAQRMRVVSQDYSAWKAFGAPEFREMIGMMGFGNLASLEVSGRSYEATIENASLPLMIVGTAAGALQSITGRKPEIEWTFSPEGDLKISAGA
jgi:hypothetical protein